jgi:hypothetical protein
MCYNMFNLFYASLEMLENALRAFPMSEDEHVVAGFADAPYLSVHDLSAGVESCLLPACC